MSVQLSLVQFIYVALYAH